MDLADPTTIVALLGAVVPAMAAGGLLVKLVEWARARSERAERREVKRRGDDASVETKFIDADLTVNERLLKRIDTLEIRMDTNAISYMASMKALEDRNDECEKRYGQLEVENEARKKRERELAEANRLMQYSYTTLRSDMSSIRKHVDRIEDENLRLRRELERRPAPAAPAGS